ncbi:MAG TPA: hypothetical protein VIH45_01240 [Desulfuromonadaceae bacterium]
MNRKRLILVALLVLLPLALVWSYRTYPRQQVAATLKYAPGSHVQAERRRPPATRTTAPAKPDNVLRLDLLDREPPVFKGYRRNIFRPAFADELKQMKQRTVVVKPPPPVLPPPPPPVLAAEVARRELARFTFLGFLKKDSRKTIFLTKDKDILLVRSGDVVAGRYEATSITDQALTLLVRDTGEEIVIPLLENRALGAAK